MIKYGIRIRIFVFPSSGEKVGSHTLRTPTHYVAQLRKRMNVDGHIKSLKSYDYHVLMHTNVGIVCAVHNDKGSSDVKLNVE